MPCTMVIGEEVNKLKFIISLASIMEQLFDYVFYLNNLSLTSFQQGNHDCAIQCIVTAIEELPFIVSFFQPESPRSDQTTESDQEIREKSKSSQLCSAFMHWVRIAGPSSIRPQGVGAKDNLMYGYALNLSSNREHWLEGISWHAVRAALFYNLAYIHHWRATHLGVSSALTVALNLYEQARDSVHLLMARAGVGQLALAIWNNMGHIHCELLQFQQARQCFGTLRNLIKIRVDSMASLHSIEDYETFILSAMLPDPEMRLAPAA